MYVRKNRNLQTLAIGGVGTKGNVINSNGEVSEEMDRAREFSLEYKDRLRYLARAWGGDNFKELVFSNREMGGNSRFSSNPKSGSIVFPESYEGSTLIGEDTTEDIWRTLRFAMWHEAQHLRHSPQNAEAICENKNVLQNIYGPVEDMRVEEMGYKRYKGMVDEQEFLSSCIAVGLKGMIDELKKQDPDASLRDLMHPLDLFMLGMSLKSSLGSLGALTPKEMGGEYEYDDAVLNKRDFEVIDEMLEYFKRSNKNSQVTAFDMARAISTYAIQRWKIDQDPPDPNEGPDKKNQMALNGANAISQAKDQNQCQNVLKSAGVNPSGNEETPSDVQREFQNIIANVNKKIGGVKGLEQIFSLGEWTDFKDQSMIIHLIAHLRKWKVGWKEVTSEYGTDIDIEKMIERESKHEPIDDYYKSYMRLTPKDYVAIILDTSGSMQGSIETYKTAIVSVCEALEYLGTHYALYVFNDELSNLSESLTEEQKEELGVTGVTGSVKTFSERKISARGKALFAGLDADGGTPMGTSLQEFMKCPDFHRTRHLIVMSDGGATDRDNFEDALNILNRRRVDYHFIGLGEGEETKWLRMAYDTWMDNGLLPKNRFRVTSLGNIPKTIVNMLLGNRYV